jgi:hypothetical protein
MIAPLLILAPPQADGFSLESWVALAACLLIAISAIAAWTCVARLKRIEARLSELDRLGELKAAIQPLVGEHRDLDLRRVEHVLIDIRDGQRRVEDRLLSVIEGAQQRGLQSGALEPAAASTASALADRVVTRLLALGYERVQLVTPREDLPALLERDGDILVEARRDGAPCKGRVSVRGGMLTDVQIQAAYSAFP